MKVVYFGDSGSYYNINLLNRIRNDDIDCQILDIFRELKNIPRKFEKIKFVCTLESVYNLRKLLQKYGFNPDDDIAHINFVDFRYLFCVPYFRKNFKKYVIYFWGSDLYRQHKVLLKLMKPLYKNASNICFETPKIADDFHKIIPQFREKDYFLRFGLPILDEIDNANNEEIESFKTKFNIPSDKKIVVIGYNGRKEQQHINVVQNLTNDVIAKSFFIFPWTYGDASQEYVDALENLCKEKKLSYIFIKQRLSDSEIACLRYITDILVQVQTTDAFSASMLETLYAGKKVVTGNWLPYDILYENSVKMTAVSTADEGGSVLEKVIGTELSENEKMTNKQAVSKLCKWENCIEMWKGLYK